MAALRPRLVAALAVLALAGVGLVAALPWLAEWAALSALRARGVESAALRVDRLGLGGMRVAELRIGEPPAVRVDSIAASWSLRGLAQRRLDRLEIDGLELRARRTPEGVSLGALDALRGGGDAGSDAGTVLPISLAEVALRRVSVLLEDGGSVHTLRARARASLTRRGLDSLDAHVELDGGRARAELAAGGALRIEATVEPSTGARWIAFLPGVRADGVGLELALEGTLPGAADAFAAATNLLDAGRLDGRLALAIERFAGLAEADPLDAGLEADVALTPSGVELRLRDCAALRLSGRLSATLRLASAFAPCIAPAEAPLLVVASGPSGWSARGALRVPETGLSLDGAGDEGWSPLLRGSAPRLDVAIGYAGADGVFARVDVEGGALRLPAADLALVGASGTAELRAADSSGSLRLRVDRLEHGGVRLARPLVLTASGRPGESEGLAFEVELEDSDAQLRLSATGSHDPASGAGRATLRLAPLELGPGAASLPELSPFLGDLVTTASGSLSGSGRFAWSAAGLDSTLDIAARELSLETEGVTLTRAAGRVHLDGLAPLSAPAGQRLEFAKLEAGIPLTDGWLSFGIERGGRLVLDRFEGGLAGGLLRASGRLDFSGIEQEVALDVERIDVGTLLGLAGVEDLEASGSLDGRIDVTLAAGSIEIRTGRLHSGSDGGVIRYRGARLPAALAGAGERGELLLRALRDFRYERLDARVEGDLTQEVRAFVRLSGSSPRVENGRPIEIELNVGSEFGEVVRASRLWRIWMERIERRLERS